MGNWMTVNLRGTLAAEDVAKATEFLTVNDDWSNFGPLSYSPGLCGLGEWAREVISANGNLSERDYSTDSVVDFLRGLVAVAPSLNLKVHCGGDYESKTCVATITVHDGDVSVGDPEVAQVGGADQDAVLGRLFKAMGGGVA